MAGGVEYSLHNALALTLTTALQAKPGGVQGAVVKGGKGVLAWLSACALAALASPCEAVTPPGRWDPRGAYGDMPRPSRLRSSASAAVEQSGCPGRGQGEGSKAFPSLKWRRLPARAIW